MPHIQVPRQKPFLFNSLFPLRLPPGWVSPLPFSSLHIHLFCTWMLILPFTAHLLTFLCHSSNRNNLMEKKTHHCFLFFFYLNLSTSWKLLELTTSCPTPFPVPGFHTSLITPLLSCFLFYFAIEFANPATSSLATCNPKLRWEFFAPPGKPSTNKQLFRLISLPPFPPCHFNNLCSLLTFNDIEDSV